MAADQLVADLQQLLALWASRWLIGRLHALSAPERSGTTLYADEANSPGTAPAQTN